MLKLKKNINDFKEDIKEPKKNYLILKENFLNLKKSNLLEDIPEDFLKDCEDALMNIGELVSPRTYDRAFKIWKLAETSKIIKNASDNNEEGDYLMTLLNSFLLELRFAPETMKNSPIPSLLIGIGAMILAAFPVWSIISIIIGTYELLNRDYRNRLIGIAIFISVAISLVFNYVVLR